MRRLPVYIMIQTSGAMRGEPIESIKVGLDAMISSLRQDPFALESVYISIITFNRSSELIIPLTELENVQIPVIKTPESGPTHLGEALKYVCDNIDTEIQLTSIDKKGDWMPLLFIMCDGRVSDPQQFNLIIKEIHKKKFGCIVACLVGERTNIDNLRKFTENILKLETTDSRSFIQFFKWVSASVCVGNRSLGASDHLKLPSIPLEVNSII